MKLALIVDKSEAYASFQRDRVLKEWGVDRTDTRSANSLTEVGTATLFGDVSTTMIQVHKGEDVKRLTEELDKHTKETLSDVFSSGIVITVTVDRRQTKKLENMVKAFGGELIVPAGNNDDPLAVKLVKGLNLQPSVRDFLLGYVGQDHEALLPMIESLSSLPKHQHKLITEEDIYLRLPLPPGSVPPWEIEKHIMAGDVSKSIETARRISQHASHLLWLAVIKKKVVTAYRASQIMAANPRISNDDLAAAMGLPTKGFYFVRKSAQSIGAERLGLAAETIVQAEAKMKGYSSAPGAALSELLVVELCHILGGSK